MRFPPHVLDEIRARLSVSAVVGRRVPLKKKGREFAGLSPFKTEKTPSFFVNDQKGFYHCFASGEHGDIFTFLMKTEGLSFPEAVERLAGEAGVALPKPNPREIEHADRTSRLYDVLAAAQDLFARALHSAAARDARSYLERRGLDAETIEAFGIGYAADDRAALSEALRAKGFTDNELTEAGLRIAGPDIPRPYDRFRNRIMFPIHDLKGRVIAFGARALDPSQPAKYLNSPETPVFHKGRVLFNAARARRSAHETEQIIVVEGYMDAVSLAQAGIDNAVAPLGTALTAEQLSLLWRFAPEPTLCFDGDAAGQKAAFRALDVALPMLKPGVSLRFAFLPDGLDPDDLVRRDGPQAFRRVVASARPLIDVLWQREFTAGEWTTPERRAWLERRIADLSGTIEDAGVRAHYARALRDRLFEAWRSKPKGPAPARVSSARGPASPRGREQQSTRQTGHNLALTSSLKQSRIVVSDRADALAPELAIVRLILEHLWLLDEHSETVAGLAWSDPLHQRVIETLLNWHDDDKTLDIPRLATQVAEVGWQESLSIEVMSATRGGPADSEARRHVEDEFQSGMRRLRARMLRSDLDEAVADFEASGSEVDGDRILEIRRLLSSLEIAEASPTDTFTPQR